MTDPRTLTRFVRSFDICLSLLDALDEPKSAPELAEECEVSPATVYRYLDHFDESGMVRVEGKKLKEMANPNSAYKTYIRTVDELKFDLDGHAQAPDNLRYFEDPDANRQ